MHMRARRTFRIAVGTCVAFATACTAGETPQRIDPLTRLQTLGAAWLETPATVTYSTLEHTAGSATSVHQCLRQVVETSVEAAIRMCNPKGELTLTWDPPDRWRMEISNDRGSATLLSTPDGAYRCRRPADEARACASTSAELTSVGSFGSILRPPSEVLEMLGADVGDGLSARPERRIAGLRSECFSAARQSADGETNRADWCFSEDGILLWSHVEIDGDVAQLEAVDVSSEVSETAFDVDRDG